MKRILSGFLTIAFIFAFCSVHTVLAVQLEGDYDVNITQCEENNGAIVVKGKIEPSLEYGLKLIIKDGEDIKHTSLTTSLSDGSFAFPSWVVPESDYDINYSVLVEPVHPETVFNGFSFSDEFSQAPTTDKYTVATTSWDETNECVKAQSGTSRARLIKDFDGDRANGEAAIQADIMKKDKTASSRLFRSMGVNGEVTAFTVSATTEDIVAKAGDESVTLTLVEDYETNRYYTINSVNDIKAMRVEFFVNGEYKGILSYKGYNDAKLSKIYRVFDTSSEVGDGAHYIDNLSIKHGTTSKKWVDGDNASVLIYRSSLTQEVVSAIENATKDTLWSELETFFELGLDTTLLDYVTDSVAAAELMLTGNNNSISAVKQNYSKSIMIQRIKENSSATAQIINEMAVGSGVEIDAPLSENDMLVRLIGNSASDIESFEHFNSLMERSILCSKIVAQPFASVEENKNLLSENYNLSEEYLLLNDTDRETAASCASGYIYSGATADDALRELISLINEKALVLIKNVPQISGDYSITIEECVAYENSVKIKGNIGVEAQYKLLVEIKNNDSVVYTKEIQSAIDGKFEHECTLPVNATDIDYDVTVSPVEPTVIYTTEHSDDFSADLSGNYLVYRNVDRDENKGKEAPSIKVSYEVTDEKSPRILLSSETLRNKNSGELCVEADILKTEKTASDNLLSSWEYTGNHVAYTIKADEHKIFATAPSGELVLIPDYKINNWYTLRVNVDLSGKRILFYVNDIYRGMLSYKWQASSITNLGRAFDTGENNIGNAHYIDNVSVFIGTYSTDKYWLNSAQTQVRVYGSDYVAEALREINGCTKETLRGKLETYNNVCKLQLDIYDNLTDSYAAAEFFLTKDYTSISSLRENYVKSIMAQSIKENGSQLKTILLTYEQESNTNIENINLDSSIFSSIVNSTIASALTLDAFDILLEKAEIASNLMDSTKLDIGDIFEGYSEILIEKYSLSNEYTSLSEEQKDSAAQAILDRTYTDYNAHTLLADIVGEVNSEISEITSSTPEGDEDTETDTTPSYTGGGGGGGGGGIKPAAPQVKREEVEQPQNITGEKFSDVNKNHWAYHSIVYLADLGVINGKGDETFAPDDTVKREEFVKILVLAKKLSLTSENIHFEDVPADSWFGAYVSTAVKNGIISGIGENRFGSGMGVTRQDAAVMLERSMKNMLSKSDKTENAFTDASQISDYALEAVNTLYSNEIISGMGDGSFMPEKMLTRAEAAQLIFKAFFK